ncbi:MAG: hypothetical protein JG759_1047 [Thermoanaerobacter sp.]|jgi:tRNA G10  N-methylase Trm11|nr:hypothetical protein [Thermoanaerobacter sp.]
MNEKDKCKLYRQALEKWGTAQIIIAFEEMAELQKKLCKALRGKENRIEIAEEIADVEIMLAQMKILFGIEEGVRRHKQLKLNRLKNDCKDRR